MIEDVRGITDVLDGFAARRLHTESEHGAVLDSVADVKYGATLVCAVATATVITEIIEPVVKMKTDNTRKERRFRQ